MDSAKTINVGDIAVDWKNGTIWVGAGESNSSRSSYAGIGMLKSTDKGKTWKNTLFINENSGVIDISVSPIARVLMFLNFSISNC